ncbi:28536_t:CDS:1, partial [Dentiscutata erythropus]
FVTSSHEIWLRAVHKMFDYCHQNNFLHVWAYCWNKWYRWDRWKLWALSATPEISIIQTTIIIETHWQILKRDYLYKFNQPYIDLVYYILIEKLLPM